MKHSIRQRVINEYGLPVVKIETVNGELGSGIRDINGREFFEGDRVIYAGQGYVVEYSNGHFGLTNNAGDWRDLDLCIGGEVFGHAEDAK